MKLSEAPPPNPMTPELTGGVAERLFTVCSCEVADVPEVKSKV